MSSVSFERICNLLHYIHQNLDQPLSLEELAQQSCWSRWQLQRVFHNETGLTVANYVRELKLSEAAERLLSGSERVIDVAMALGFNSEISFSRTFKQHFGLSPSQYRKQGQRTGLRKPLQAREFSPRDDITARLIEVRVESRGPFELFGMAITIRGLFSADPDFATQVPKIWQQFSASQPAVQRSALTGVIDVTQAGTEYGQLTYWAACDNSSQGLETIRIPAQTYAVVKHRGPVTALATTLEWFLSDWLPQSSYRGVDGIELECYPAGYDCQSTEAVMEYWLPVSMQNR